MKRTAIHLYGLTFFVVLHAAPVSAATFCELMFYKLPSTTTPLFEEMKGVISRAARHQEPLMFSSLSRLRANLQSVQTAAITRMQENGKILFESNQPFGKSLQGVTELLLPFTELKSQSDPLKNSAGKPLRHQAVKALMEQISKKGLEIKSEQRLTEVVENELRRNLRLTQNLIRRIRHQVREIVALEAWALETHRETPLITLNSFRAELNGQRNLLENQIHFLESFFQRFDQALVHVVEATNRFRSFFANQWPMSQQFLWAQKIPFTNFVGTEPPLEEREKAFDRQFYVGDRLINVRQRDSSFSAGKPTEMFVGTYAERWVEENYGFQKKVGPAFEGLNYHFVEEKKALGITWRKPKTITTPKFYFFEDDLNYIPAGNLQYRDSTFLSFLANPKMNIDGHSLGDTLELDLAKMSDYKKSAQLANRMYFSMSHTYASDNPVDPHYAANAIQVVKGWEERGARVFVRVLGTNPINNGLLVALWTADQKLGLVQEYKLRILRRQDLEFFMPFDEYFFFWPELEKLGLNPQAAFVKPERM